MIKLGLTGSMATGKSTVASMFGKRHVPIYDADKAVHKLYQNEAIVPVGKAFPKAVIDGKIDRAALAGEVLGDKGKLAQLEAIVHPLVHQKMHEFISFHQNVGQKLVVLEIPLLFETGKAYPLDKIAVTFCDDQTQKQRAMARPGMSEEKFAAIKERQMSQQDKKQRADFLIDTGKTPDQTQQMVDDIIQTCRALVND
ncbi:dephospho-CoA kinase [Maritalea porphyrae]|uniref:dephospho-CoA kinase n=1 Tax=Maritalea porphyrae TaxID=880732 RepID=UPI0022AFAD08|nr:dephospho-CoA kinase [Maritalea porphyrae]MCZ4272253.1 dephospho-CoA kinase [Maritalea porphyrae]